MESRQFTGLLWTNWSRRPMVVREGTLLALREEPLKNRRIRILTAVLLLACALPLAEAGPPKRNCGGRCDLDYSTCLQRAGNRAAKHTCKVAHKMCKRYC